MLAQTLAKWLGNSSLSSRRSISRERGAADEGVIAAALGRLELVVGPALLDLLVDECDLLGPADVRDHDVLDHLRLDLGLYGLRVNLGLLRGRGRAWPPDQDAEAEQPDPDKHQPPQTGQAQDC